MPVVLQDGNVPCGMGSHQPRERRRRPRFPVRLISIFGPQERGDRYGIVLNLSARGMLVATASRVLIGSRIQVRVQCAGQPQGWVAIAGRVVRLALNNDASVVWVRFLCAIEFSEELSASSLSTLLAATERR